MELLLSVVLPLRNDVEVLRARLPLLHSCLERQVSYEILVVDNGSSPENQRRLEPFADAVRIFRHPQGNIGLAQRYGLSQARGEWVYLLPLDEFEPEFLPWAWRHRFEYDLILGSKRVDPSLCQQSALRRWLSWGLNAFLELACQSPLADTHGQKLLRRVALEPLISECRMQAGLFETELVLRALRAGLRLAEVPVAYRDFRPPRNSMLEKVLRNLWGVFQLARIMRPVPWKQSPHYRRFCRADLAHEEFQTTTERDSRAYHHSDLSGPRGSSPSA